MIRDIIITIIATAIFGIGIWGGSTIATVNANRQLATAIQNAVYHERETAPAPMDCKTSELVNAIKTLSNNGVPITSYSMQVFVDNTLEEDKCNAGN